MNVILHIGLAKTGTTFLQMWLYLNRAALAEQNLAAFDPLISHRLAVECIDDPQTTSRSDILDIKSNMPLDTALNEARISQSGSYCINRAILSSEYFSVTPPALTRKHFDLWNLSVIQIILYVRRQDLYAAAGYTQDVIALGQKLPFVDIPNPPYGVSLNWTQMHENWRRSFPEASIFARNYENYKRDNQLLADFSNLLGYVGEKDSIIPERANEGLNSELTEFARMLNVQGFPVSRSSLLKIQRTMNGPRYGFSSWLIEEFERRYRPSNIELAASFPGEFDSLAEPNWEPTGIDLTGLISPARFDGLRSSMLDLQGQRQDTESVSPPPVYEDQRSIAPATPIRLLLSWLQFFTIRLRMRR